MRFTGNGKSGKLLEILHEIIETQCLDLIMLLNDLGIREAVFVGIAYGGLVVQHIAKQYPERVKAIVVADSFCRTHGSTIVGKIQTMAAYCSLLMYYLPSELVLPSIRMMYRALESGTTMRLEEGCWTNVPGSYIGKGWLRAMLITPDA